MPHKKLIQPLSDALGGFELDRFKLFAKALLAVPKSEITPAKESACPKKNDSIAARYVGWIRAGSLQAVCKGSACCFKIGDMPVEQVLAKLESDKLKINAKLVEVRREPAQREVTAKPSSRS